MEDLIFIKNTTWPEVFEGWQDREAKDPGWIECATKIKDWSDWESWRKYTATQLRADNREWKIYKITDANKVVPAMLVGPYTGWQNRLSVRNVLSFAEMLKIPENYEALSKNDKVLGMMKNWPANTQFIGAVRADNNKIVCVEGHHMATTIALAAKNGQPLPLVDEITIALCGLALGEEKLLDEALARGSQKPGQGENVRFGTRELSKRFLANNAKIKKAVGLLLIIVGLFLLVTPLTPGSWLAFVGLEFLGIRFFTADKLKKWF